MPLAFCKSFSTKKKERLMLYLSIIVVVVVVNECEKNCWKSVKFRYVFLPKKEGCSSSSSTTSSVVNWSFRFDDDAGCFPP